MSLFGLMVAVASGAAWTWLTFIQGPLSMHDSAGYLALADALQQGHASVVERPDRTPGYPVFLILCRAVSAPFGWNAPTTATIVQTLLLAGVGSWLLFDMARRLAGGIPAGVAAILYASDADMQVFGRALMTEALAIWLIVLAGWLRLRDGDWRYARWAAAALALTRPHLACVAIGFAMIELVRGRIHDASSLAVPTLIALVGWLVFAGATGGRFVDGSRRMQALHQFGTAYEAELWRRMPDGDLRTALSRSWDAKQDAYAAASSLTGQAEPWNPGGDWQPLASAATAMIHADPLGYVWARIALMAAVYRESAFPWSAFASVPKQAALPGGHVALWSQLAHLGKLHHALFFSSFALFVLLVIVSTLNGVGYTEAIDPIRSVIVPFIVFVIASTALLSLGAHEVGRLGLPAHPFIALIWALAVGRAIETALGTMRRRPKRVARSS